MTNYDRKPMHNFDTPTPKEKKEEKPKKRGFSWLNIIGILIGVAIVLFGFFIADTTPREYSRGHSHDLSLTPGTIEAPQPCNGGCLASEECLGQNGLTCDCAEWDPIDPAQCMKYERCDCILHGSGAAKLRISLPEGGNMYIETAKEHNYSLTYK